MVATIIRNYPHLRDVQTEKGNPVVKTVGENIKKLTRIYIRQSMDMEFVFSLQIFRLLLVAVILSILNKYDSGRLQSRCTMRLVEFFNTEFQVLYN